MNMKQARDIVERGEAGIVKRLRDERAPDPVPLDPWPFAFLDAWQRARHGWKVIGCDFGSEPSTFAIVDVPPRHAMTQGLTGLFKPLDKDLW